MLFPAGCEASPWGSLALLVWSKNDCVECSFSWFLSLGPHSSSFDSERLAWWGELEMGLLSLLPAPVPGLPGRQCVDCDLVT